MDRGKESAADVPGVGQSLQGGLNCALMLNSSEVQGVQACLSDESVAVQGIQYPLVALRDSGASSWPLGRVCFGVGHTWI